jgi:hypothetical protein
MEQILETMEDIKRNIKDDEYKKIMDGLKTIYDTPEYKARGGQETEKYIEFVNWLEARIIHCKGCNIRKDALIKYIIINKYNDIYFTNIDFVKKSLEMHLKNNNNSPSYFSDVYLREGRI